MENISMSDNVSSHNEPASKDGIQKATPVMAGLMVFLIFWSFYFTPERGEPFDEIMGKMLGPGPVFFAGLGLLVTLLVPGVWSLRSGLTALVTAGVLAGGIWLSTL